MENKIIEGNRLIAEFLELRETHPTENNWYMIPKNFVFNTYNNWSYLHFHESWDWIMKACRKWYALEVPFYMHHKKKILDNELGDPILGFAIAVAWEKLVECLTWYKNQTS